MTGTRHVAEVAAPPDQVWELLARFDRIADWADSVDHSTALTAQERGVGAARRVQVGSLVLVESITDWDPPHRLAYELQGLPPMVSRVVNEWTIEVSGTGCRVELAAHITAGPRPPMRAAARLLGRRIGSTNAGMLADLAREAEGST